MGTGDCSGAFHSPECVCVGSHCPITDSAWLSRRREWREMVKIIFVSFSMCALQRRKNIVLSEEHASNTKGCSDGRRKSTLGLGEGKDAQERAKKKTPRDWIWRSSILHVDRVFKNSCGLRRFHASVICPDCAWQTAIDKKDIFLKRNRHCPPFPPLFF